LNLSERLENTLHDHAVPRPFAAPSKIAAPPVFPESCADVGLSPQSNQQAERLFYRLLLRLPRNLLRFGRERVIDFDRGPHR
jgi:hypothetical protein